MMAGGIKTEYLAELPGSANPARVVSAEHANSLREKLAASDLPSGNPPTVTFAAGTFTCKSFGNGKV
jgi:hypothetical protein